VPDLDPTKPCILVSTPIGGIGCGEGSNEALPLEQQYDDLQSALAGVKDVPISHRATSVQQGLLEIAIEKAAEMATEKITKSFDLGSGPIKFLADQLIG
jgi:hypothetical protein